MRKLHLLIFVVLALAFSIQAQTSTNNSSSSSSTAETKEKKKVFRATKDQITQAQKMLKEKGKYAGAEDGKYNDDFRASVKGFQGENGLKKSGGLNRATLEKMGIALTDTQKEIPVNPNDLASADAVKNHPSNAVLFSAPAKIKSRKFKRNLKPAECMRAKRPENSMIRRATAIKKWQTANGVKVTGTLNKETLEKMGIELTEKQKAM